MGIKIRRSSILHFLLLWTVLDVCPSIAHSQQSPADPELRMYQKWYQALHNRELGAVIARGIEYLESNPTGKFARFVEEIVRFARTATDTELLARAQRLRLKFAGSLDSTKIELESLLNQMLVDGASIDVKALDGKTPLMFAASKGDAQAVKALLQRHVDVDSTEGTHGWTALVYAIWSGNPGVVREILYAYPDPSIRDKDGWSDLEHAVASCNFEIMLLLNGRPRRGVSN